MGTKAKAIRMAAQGGPDVLKLETVELAAPGNGEVLMRQTAIGLNFIDVYFRDGSYALDLPAGVGAEAAGVVEAVGAGVTEFKVGDRVAYGGSAPGAYASHRLMPAARLVPIPQSVSDEAAAAVLMKGMTAEYLLNRCVAVKPGQQVLFYAASGGVGLIAGQWGKHLGARMIGVTSGDKAALALSHGYDVVIDRKTERIPDRVKALTDGKGVAVAFDSVGKDSFEATLASLAPRGFFVTFGATTGAPPPLEAALLQKNGSLYYTRPTLATYIAARDDLVASAAAVFDLVGKGIIKPMIGHRYALAEAAAAHRDLEAGTTRGSSLLIP
ncbi:quinone oxidoreductase [Bradyrhizobium liaoningense]|uniref:quinone oxidoreductase family protein n=1 Tax=Bradyrhizobium liaoningense TaxID=43992 RepID=UPI001BA8D092|nr:quinone oxidoreductase [Bradyrhizobium liaoningense]MBR0823476.1 quinone oxidoreductase [Bradyrhizobium liaoningense]